MPGFLEIAGFYPAPAGQDTCRPPLRGAGELSYGAGALGARTLKVHIISLDIFTIMIYAGSVFPERGGRDAQAGWPLPYDVYETRALTDISGKITEC